MDFNFGFFEFFVIDFDISFYDVVGNDWVDVFGGVSEDDVVWVEGYDFGDVVEDFGDVEEY